MVLGGREGSIEEAATKWPSVHRGQGHFRENSKGRDWMRHVEGQ